MKRRRFGQGLIEYMLVAGVTAFAHTRGFSRMACSIDSEPHADTAVLLLAIVVLALPCVAGRSKSRR